MDGSRGILSWPYVYKWKYRSIREAVCCSCIRQRCTAWCMRIGTSIDYVKGKYTKNTWHKLTNVLNLRLLVVSSSHRSSVWREFALIIFCTLEANAYYFEGSDTRMRLMSSTWPLDGSKTVFGWKWTTWPESSTRLYKNVHFFKFKFKP